MFFLARSGMFRSSNSNNSAAQLVMVIGGANMIWRLFLGFIAICPHVRGCKIKYQFYIVLYVLGKLPCFEYFWTLRWRCCHYLVGVFKRYRIFLRLRCSLCVSVW